MLAQIIATIAYAGPRWLRENRLTVVYKSETRSPVPSSVATIARTTMPGSDLKPATMRLKAPVTTLPSAIPAQPQTLTQYGNVRATFDHRCVSVAISPVQEADMEGCSHPLLSTSGMEFSS
jgi:hypothetical protein